VPPRLVQWPLQQADVHGAPAPRALRMAPGPHMDTSHQPMGLVTQLLHLVSSTAGAKRPREDLTHYRQAAPASLRESKMNYQQQSRSVLVPFQKNLPFQSNLSFPFTWEIMHRTVLTSMNTDPGPTLPSSDPTAVQAQPLVLKHKLVTPSRPKRDLVWRSKAERRL